jgi:hypothetical protein
MSMRHHWQELDELLAQLDREARFKQGPFRPGLKALQGAGSPAGDAAIPGTAAEEGLIIPLKPEKSPRTP